MVSCRHNQSEYRRWRVYQCCLESELVFWWVRGMVACFDKQGTKAYIYGMLTEQAVIDHRSISDNLRSMEQRLQDGLITRGFDFLGRIQFANTSFWTAVPSVTAHNFGLALSVRSHRLADHGFNLVSHLCQIWMDCGTTLGSSSDKRMVVTGFRWTIFTSIWCYSSSTS